MNNPRNKEAYKYLKALEQAMQVDWHTTVARYESSKDLYIGLSLLHPCYLEGVGCSEKEAKSLIERVQGQRAFVGSGAGKPCRSELLWGYECPLSSDEMQLDHLFPYSLGGPTIGANAIPLCRIHNLMKSSDIHCFPWECADTRLSPWLDNQIKKVQDALTPYLGVDMA